MYYAIESNIKYTKYDVLFGLEKPSTILIHTILFYKLYRKRLIEKSKSIWTPEEIESGTLSVVIVRGHKK